MMVPIRILLLIVLMLMWAPFSEVNASGDQRTAELVVFRVFPVIESEGSRRVARSELKCDPCNEVIDDRDGSRTRYLLNPDAAIHLSADAIESAGVEAGAQGAVVFVVLTSHGKSMLESLIVSRTDVAADVVNGKIVGFGPLRLSESRYLVVMAASRADAEELAQMLRPSTR
jgi:hypothetical protein